MESELELIETIFGPMYSPKNDYITNHLREYGAHQRNELAMVLSVLRPGDKVIDVGAHIGTFCIPIGKKVGDFGHVYAFEGAIDNHRLLERNISINKAQQIITTYQAIVTNCQGSFLVGLDAGNTGATFFTRSQGQISVNSCCMVLDEWWDYDSSKRTGNATIDLIKIDVEGMELDVLRGCERILAKYKPIIYMEVSRAQLGRYGVDVSELDSYLQQFGYHYFRNVGVRHSQVDEFEIARLGKLENGGAFFDVLAMHPGSDRYRQCRQAAMHTSIKLWLGSTTTKYKIRRVTRYVRSLEQYVRRQLRY